MEAHNNIFILWDVFDRLLISHVLFGSILPHARGGGLQGENRTFRHDDFIWSYYHDCDSAFRQRAFSRELFILYDGICMGTAQRRYEDVISRCLYIQRTIPSMGNVSIFDVVRTLSDN